MRRRTDLEIRLEPFENGWQWEVVNLKSGISTGKGFNLNKGEALRDARQSIAFSIVDVIVKEEQA